MMARGLTGRAWLVWLAAALLALAPLLFGDYWTGLLTQAVIFGGVAVGLDILAEGRHPGEPARVRPQRR